MVCCYNVRQLFKTKCDKCYYKVRQVLQSATILLQSVTGVTKCYDYFKVRQNRGIPLIWSEVLNPNDIVFYLYLIKIRSRAILGF